MQVFDYVVFGVIVGIASLIMYLLLKYTESYNEDIVLRQLEKYPELQEKIKNKFNWK